MSSGRRGNGAGASAPALLPFITLRAERSGGMLFNPYLPLEVELDAAETLLAGLCDGSRPRDEILSRCQAAYGCNARESVRRWEALLAKLNRAMAVRFLKEPAPALARPAPAEPVESPAAFSAPKSVIWDVTYACNLSCAHCLTDSGAARGGELTTAQAKVLIGKLSAAKVLYVSLTGGEPFVRGDILEILAGLAETGMRVDVATNGVDWRPGIIEALRELPVFHIQVSLDGIGARHDEFRGRRGAFEAACRTLRLLKDEGLATSVNTTVTRNNVDQLAALIDLAVKLGCDAFKAIPFLPAGRGSRAAAHLSLDADGSLAMNRILIAKSREKAGRIAISTESTFSFLLEQATLPVEAADGAMQCSAGYDELNIGADGTVYPCPFLRDFPVGNLLTDSMTAIWHESPLLNALRTLRKSEMSGPCATCLHAPASCHGGCRASALLAHGDLKGSDPLCFRALLDSERQAGAPCRA